MEYIVKRFFEDPKRSWTIFLLVKAIVILIKIGRLKARLLSTARALREPLPRGHTSATRVEWWRRLHLVLG